MALCPPGPIASIWSMVISHSVREHTGTLVHETGSTTAWFITKEYFAQKLVQWWVWQDLSYSSGATNMNTELLAWELAASGVIAGAVSTLMFYPANMVKSVIQTEEELRWHSARRNSGRSSFVGTFQKMWA